LLAPRPTPKLEDHPLSAVRDCLFNILAATLHIGGRSSIRNLRTRHAVVRGTHLRFTRSFCLKKNTTHGSVSSAWRTHAHTQYVRYLFFSSAHSRQFCPTVSPSLNLRLLMSYIYGAPILDVSRSHTTTHHSR